MNEDILQIIEATQNPNTEVRNKAVQQLEIAVANNFQGVINSLIELFSNVNNSQYIRCSSGLFVKNMLTSRSISIQKILISKWNLLDNQFRLQIKNIVLSILGTESYKPSICSQVISSIAYAELTNHTWPELIPYLTNNIIKDDITLNVREASIETIGVMCQDLPPNLLTNYSSDILYSITFCMKKQENQRIRLVSTKALYNSLDFVFKNFEVESQRNLIMECICQNCVDDSDIQLKVISLQCLCRIVSLYYEYMETYMNQALFAITLDAIKSPHSQVVLQGIEFWSSLCEEEQILLSGKFQQFDNNSTVFQNYSSKALPYIIPHLLDQLCQNSDHYDDDEWNPHKASSVCILLLSSVCGDEIIPHLIPFVISNYQSDNVNARNACALCLGSLLDGPSDEKLLTISAQLHSFTVKLIQDTSPIVRGSAYWALGKLYECWPEMARNQELTIQSLSLAFVSLGDIPSVATDCCWAFIYMIKAIIKVSINIDEETCRTTYISKEFKNLLYASYSTIKRSDAIGTSLLSASFELFNTLIENHSLDNHFDVMSYFSNVLQDINLVFNTDVPINVGILQYQSFYCICVQNYIKTMNDIEFNQIAETLMYNLIQFINQSLTSIVIEDLLLTFGIFVQNSPDKLIIDNLHHFMSYFIQFLKDLQNINVCMASTIVIGDICTKTGKHVHSYTNEIMIILFQHLLNDTIDINLKSSFINLIGDIALSIGSKFSQFLPNTLNIIKLTSSIDYIPEDDDDYIESIEILRTNCISTYTSIIQGLYQSNNISSSDLQLWQPNISHIFVLIEKISMQEYNDEMTRTACGLLGDLINIFNIHISSILNENSIQTLLQRATTSNINKTKNVGYWLQNLLSGSV